jgi:hypothetical protein
MPQFGMATEVIALVIRGDAADSVAHFVQPLLLPYLKRVAGDARFMADRIQRKLVGKDGGARSRVIEIEIAAIERVDLDDVASKLEGFLRVAVRHADLAATFEVFQFEASAELDNGEIRAKP